MKYWYRHCPLCEGQGQLRIRLDPVRDQLFLQCDECYLEFDDPDHVSLAGGAKRPHLRDPNVVDADPAAIERFGWIKYALNTYPA